MPMRIIRTLMPLFAHVLATFMLLFIAPAARADFGDLLRAVSKSLDNNSAAQTAPKVDDQSIAGSIGIRGIDDVAGGKSAARGDVKALDAWAVSRAEAEQAARQKGLVAVDAKMGAAAQ